MIVQYTVIGFPSQRRRFIFYAQNFTFPRVGRSYCPGQIVLLSYFGYASHQLLQRSLPSTPVQININTIATKSTIPPIECYPISGLLRMAYYMAEHLTFNTLEWLTDAKVI